MEHRSLLPPHSNIKLTRREVGKASARRLRKPKAIANIKSNPGPTDETDVFAVVAIGASAGGLEAFTQLLSALPNNTGMAFVLIQHLAPTHHSLLSELLAKKTKMPVLEAKDGTTVEPNHVYVIPPNVNMGIQRRRPR